METTGEKIRKEWAAFLQMSFGQKLEHIWIYYKWAIVVLIVVGILLAYTVDIVRTNMRQQLISGIFVNNATTSEGYAYLDDGYWEYCGGNKNQRVELIEARMIDFDAEPMGEADAANLMVLVGMISAQSLDYIITDAATLQFLDEQEVLLDLREILPEETLAGLKTYEGAAGIIAIGLNGTAFDEQFSLMNPESCIVIVSNTKTPEGAVRFLNYLLQEA